MAVEKAFAKLVKISNNGIYALVDLGGEKPEWCNLEEKVKVFLSSDGCSVKAGVEVDMEYTTVNGKKTISRIAPHKENTAEAPKVEGSAPEPSVEEVKGQVCSKCGKVIEEKVYNFSTKKYGVALCMDCQAKANSDKKAEEPKNESKPVEKKYYGKSPEELENIVRTNCNNATAQTLTALQGQIDPNMVKELATSLYLHYYYLATTPIAEIKKKFEA